MKTLELFAGTGSFTKVMREAGHETYQLELYPCEENPVDYEVDVMQMHKVSQLWNRNWDWVWASPPCTGFSIASVSHHWVTTDEGKRYPKSETGREGLNMLRSTLLYIALEKPKVWFIENPRGMMRKIFDEEAHKVGLTNYTRHTVTYCQYGDDRMKPTDIWTNAEWWEPRPMCKNGMPCHVAAPRGAKTGTQGLKGARERSRIPSELFTEILNQHEANPTRTKK